jgi:hypothetical protein
MVCYSWPRWVRRCSESASCRPRETMDRCSRQLDYSGAKMRLSPLLKKKRPVTPAIKCCWMEWYCTFQSRKWFFGNEHEFRVITQSPVTKRQTRTHCIWRIRPSSRNEAFLPDRKNMKKLCICKPLLLCKPLWLRKRLLLCKPWFFGFNVALPMRVQNFSENSKTWQTSWGFARHSNFKF